MTTEFSIVIKKEINAPSSKVWDALTNPEIIKQYLFGTETVTDWKVGSPIIFQGKWEGMEYKDKGTILEFIPGQKLKYDYWSSFSKLEDVPENYQILTFDLKSQDGNTILSLTQDNVPNPETKKHSEANWSMVLNLMKEIIEK